jgi:hypothetical protein
VGLTRMQVSQGIVRPAQSFEISRSRIFNEAEAPKNTKPIRRSEWALLVHSSDLGVSRGGQS